MHSKQAYYTNAIERGVVDKPIQRTVRMHLKQAHSNALRSRIILLQVILILILFGTLRATQYRCNYGRFWKSSRTFGEVATS